MLRLPIFLALVRLFSTQAENFILQTNFAKTDTTCSTWQMKLMMGDAPQDFCQSLGDASNYGMTSSTGKLYVKRTCGATNVTTTYYSDSACADALTDPAPQEQALSCSHSAFENSYITLTCGQSYPAAKWKYYTDNQCQTIDTTKKESAVPLNFCAANTEGRWEFSSKGRQIRCTASGLETVLWQNSDCTGSSNVKIDRAISKSCDGSTYYNSNVQTDCSDSVSVSMSSSSFSIVPFSLIAVFVSLWT